MTKHILQSLIVIAALCATTTASAEACFEVDARPTNHAANGPAIQFTLLNECAYDVKLAPLFAPWGAYQSVDLDAVADEPPQLGLEKLAPLYHDFHESVSISPGSRLSGLVPMTFWFPKFMEINQRSSITVHWSYSWPQTVGAGWTTGNVVFPRASNDEGSR